MTTRRAKAPRTPSFHLEALDRHVPPPPRLHPHSTLSLVCLPAPPILCLFPSNRQAAAPRSKGSTQYQPLPPERKLRKNNREKQRRNELNENFELLCAVLNLNSKSEKSNCLAEAISHIQALRARVEQLEALTSRAWIRILSY
jgi:hypothetical protein